MLKIEKKLDEIVCQILNGNVKNEILKNFVGDGKNQVYYALSAFKKLVKSLTESKLSKETELEVYNSLFMLLDVTGNHHQLSYVLYQNTHTEKNPEVLKKYVQLCKLRAEPIGENFQLYLLTTESLLQNLFQDSMNADHWNVIKSNFKFILSAAFGDSKQLMMAIQSLYRHLPHKLKTPDQIFKTVEFLEATLLTAIPKIKFQIESEELFNSFITFMDYIPFYSRYNPKIVKIFEKISATFSKQNCFEIHPEYKDCVDVLNICYKYYNDIDLNSETHLNELHTKYYSGSSKKTYSPAFVKTSVIVSRILVSKLKDQQITKPVAAIFLKITYTLMSILRCLNSEPKNLVCAKCSDMKRHESIALLNSMSIMYMKLVKSLEITNSLARKIIPNIKYRFELCDDLKCASKDVHVLTSLNYLTNIICAFVRSKELIPLNYSTLNDVMKLIFHYQFKYKIQTIDCFNFAWGIYSITQEDDTNIHHQLSGLGSLIYYLNKTIKEVGDADDAIKKRLSKTVWQALVLTKKLKYPSIADYLNSKEFCNLKFVDETEVITRGELLLLEMKTIYRYDTAPSDDENIKLFGMICDEVKDPIILAQSVQLFNDSTLSKVDTNKIMKIKKLLLGVEKNSGEIKAALGYINMHQYWKKTHEIRERIQPLMDKALVESSVEKLNLVADELLIDDELQTIEFLNEALKMFSEVYKDGSVDALASVRKATKTTENIANEYLVRNITFKAIEAFTVMYQYCTHGNNKIGYLNIATFFMDNKNLVMDDNGEVICVSDYFLTPTIKELVEKANEYISETVFVEQTVNLQSYMLSYLLSLSLYQITTGKSEGFKEMRKFQELYKNWTAEVNSSYQCMTKSKLFFVLHELSLFCNNPNAEHLLLNAILTILNVKKIETDFFTQIQIYYERLTMKSIDYHMNRHSNSEHINKLLASLQNLATKYGHSVKLMKVFSINTMRKLNMEKIDDVKNNLQTLKKLMGLKDEILVTLGCKKSETSTELFEWETQGIEARKSVLHSSPALYELNSSPNYNNEMLQQLKTYVHDANCCCKICKLPQLKLFLFQIGCFYSRLLWLMEKYDICRDFNEMAMKQWLRVNEAVEKKQYYGYMAVDKHSFKLFSIRWILHNSDVAIRMKDFKMAAEFYKQARELATDEMFDVKSIQQYLFCREENLKGLKMVHDSPRDVKGKFRYSEFLRLKTKAKNTTNIIVKPSVNFKSVIYVDSSDENEENEVIIVKKVEKKVLTKVKAATKVVAKSIEPTIKFSMKPTSSSSLTSKMTETVKINKDSPIEKIVKISSRTKPPALKAIAKVDEVAPVKTIKFSSIKQPPTSKIKILKEPAQSTTKVLQPSVKTKLEEVPKIAVKTKHEEVPKIAVKTVKDKLSDKPKVTLRSTRTRQQT